MPTAGNRNYINTKFLGANHNGKTYQYYDKSPELDLILARATEEGYTLPSWNTQIAMDVLIKAMKADGTWYKEDSILNFAYNNTGLNNFSLINWKNPMAVTNLATQSRNWADASWAGSGKTPNTVDTLAPDGSQTACKWDDTGATVLTTKVGIICNSPTLTYSLYTKAGTATTRNFILRDDTTSTNLISATLNYSTGVITGSSDATVVNVGNGWYRISLVVRNAIVGNTYRIYLGRTTLVGIGTDTWYTWGAQVEDRDKASRYIPTGSTAIFGNGIATVKGAMTYTVNGWQSNGATGATAAYIESKFNPSATGRNYTLNNAGREVVVYKANTVSQIRWLDLSRAGLPSATNVFHINQAGQSSITSRINSTAILTIPIEISSLGYKAIQRNNSANIDIIQQAVSTNFTNASTGIGTSEIILFNNIPDGNLATDAGMSIWKAGASKTFTETQNFRTYYNNYLTKIGLTAIA